MIFKMITIGNIFGVGKYLSEIERRDYSNKLEEEDLTNILWFLINLFPNPKQKLVDLIFLLKPMAIFYLLNGIKKNENPRHYDEVRNRIRMKIEEICTNIELNIENDDIEDLVKGYFEWYHRLQQIMLQKPLEKKEAFDLSNPKITQILKKQNNRCGICGILLLNYSKKEEKEVGQKIAQIQQYEEGLLDYENSIYKSKAVHLDHIWPFYLGGNVEKNLMVTCYQCNSIKQDHLHYYLISGVMNPFRLNQKDFIRINKITKQLYVACLMRDSKCVVCGSKPIEKRLYVVKKIKNGSALLDNLETRCIDCIQKELKL